MGFVKKVYSILFVQLTITFGAVWYVVSLTKNNCYSCPELTELCKVPAGDLCGFVGGTPAWMIGTGEWLWILALVMAVFTEIAIICCRHLARKVPINFMMLFFFTICEAYVLAATCVYYAATQPDVTLQAFMGTAMITLACTLYAFFTKRDMSLGGSMFFLLPMTLLFLFMMMFIFGLTGNVIGYDIIIALIVLILGIYIIVDTQMIVGKGRWKLSLDDYILGAMVLYVDIITVFLYLLALFAKK